MVLGGNDRAAPNDLQERPWCSNLMGHDVAKEQTAHLAKLTAKRNMHAKVTVDMIKLY